jgi:predicted HTH transcriptional regulator
LFLTHRQAVKDAAMAEYRKLAKSNVEQNGHSADLMRLIQSGECASVEFKPSLEYIDPQQPKVLAIPEPQREAAVANMRKNVVHSSLKTICAFLNSEGGTLLIGVHDEQYPVGIDSDLQSVKGNNTDGFEIKLRAMLNQRFDPHPIGHVAISFPTWKAS